MTSIFEVLQLLSVLVQIHAPPYACGIQINGTAMLQAEATDYNAAVSSRYVKNEPRFLSYVV